MLISKRKIEKEKELCAGPHSVCSVCTVDIFRLKIRDEMKRAHAHNGCDDDDDDDGVDALALTHRK